MNPIENIWAWLVRTIYDEGKTYNTVEDLETAIRYAWEKMPDSLIEKLVLSMINRMIALIEAQRKEIDY